MSLDPVDAAYLAGLVDGEGCIFAYKQATRAGGTTFVGGCRIHMTEPEPLLWAEETTGLGTMRTYERKSPRRPAWQWSLRLSDCQELLPMILPYLKNKKQQAELLLEFISKPRDHARRSLLVEELALCKTAHGSAQHRYD